MERYKFNPITNTLTITAGFAKKLQDTGSNEYALLRKLRADFPGLIVRSKTHKTPTRYRTNSNEEYARNPTKTLTYKNMEGFMNALPEAERYLVVYDFAKNEASKLNTAPYAVVRRWFVAQFPAFRNNPVGYLDNPPEVVTDISPFLPKGEASGDAA